MSHWDDVKERAMERTIRDLHQQIDRARQGLAAAEAGDGTKVSDWMDEIVMWQADLSAAIKASLPSGMPNGLVEWS
jgi:hypothetical protein